MVLNVHKELTDQLDLIVAAKQFVSNTNLIHSLSIFGKFTERDTVHINCYTHFKIILNYLIAY